MNRLYLYMWISNEHLLQSSKREQCKLPLASNAPILVFRIMWFHFRFNEIKFCKVKMPSIKFFFVRPRLNVELFMRRNKLSELNSWKVRRLAQLSLSEWIWIVQHVVSVCLRRIERVKIISGRSVDLHTQRAKLINEKVVRLCIFSLVWEKSY